MFNGLMYTNYKYLDSDMVKLQQIVTGSRFEVSYLWKLLGSTDINREVRYIGNVWCMSYYVICLVIYLLS